MKSEEICGSCKYHTYDKDSGDFVCSNPDSEYFADWTGWSACCGEWEEK